MRDRDADTLQTELSLLHLWFSTLSYIFLPGSFIFWSLTPMNKERPFRCFLFGWDKTYFGIDNKFVTNTKQSMILIYWPPTGFWSVTFSFAIIDTPTGESNDKSRAVHTILSLTNLETNFYISWYSFVGLLIKTLLKLLQK